MFPQGALWELVTHKTRPALASGALRPIVTRSEFLEDGGVRFLVRVISNRKEMERPSPPAGPAASPFLQRDEALFVAELSPTHVCRLNRYPVIEHHLLIVTREYEDQETPLNRADFEALALCLREYESLGFYNGGARAGASQSHKHLQLVPLPLAPSGPRIPLEPRIAVGRRSPANAGRSDAPLPRRSPALPFRHALAALDAGIFASPGEAAAAMLAHYRDLLTAVGIAPQAPRLDAYNLLVTREWMLLVPRSQEKFHSISLNALAFAGVLLVKDDAQLALLKQHGPLAALQAVA